MKNNNLFKPVSKLMGALAILLVGASISYASLIPGGTISTVLDNTLNKTNTPNVSPSSVSTTRSVATVFQVGSNSYLNSIAINVTGAITTTFAFNLMAVDANSMPTGTALASYTSGNTTVNSTPTYYTFNFGTTLSDYLLLSSNKYALVINTTSATSVNMQNFDTVYNAGLSGWSWKQNDRNIGSGWTALSTAPNASNNFAMILNASTIVPEPSTYALLCISLGVVAYARKRMVKQDEV